MPLSLFHQIVIQYIEPITIWFAVYLAFYDPQGFLKHVLYFPETQYTTIHTQPLFQHLLKFAGGMLGLFSVALYLITTFGDDRVRTYFFTAILVSDVYFMVRYFFQYSRLITNFSSLYSFTSRHFGIKG